MEFITTPYTMDDIRILKDAGADAMLFATPFYSARGAAYFSMEELPRIRQITQELHCKMYVLVNRFFMEEELHDLRKHLSYLKSLSVDGIYYGDESVLYEAKKLEMEQVLIYNPDTLITNQEDSQYYLEEDIQMITLSKEITLTEMIEIAEHVSGACEVLIHGRLNIMHSKRRLLSNYLTFLGKEETIENKRDFYIMEENRSQHMPILEDELGTHVFSGFTLVSFEEVKALANAGIQHMRIDGIFQDVQYLCRVIKLYKAILNDELDGVSAYKQFQQAYPSEEMDTGFYHRKTSKSK